MLEPDAELRGSSGRGRPGTCSRVGVRIGGNQICWRGVDIVALFAVVGVIYLALRYAAALVRLLSDNGIELLSRVVGLLLAAVGVQMVASGVESWLQHGVS